MFMFMKSSGYEHAYVIQNMSIYRDNLRNCRLDTGDSSKCFPML